MPATRPADQALPLHQAVAVGAGNALEFYDFLTFSFFSVQISHAFFPGEANGHGLLYTLATFGIGFVTRPLGGWLIGRYGDRAGRRPAMVLSFAIMGVAMPICAYPGVSARPSIATPIMAKDSTIAGRRPARSPYRPISQPPSGRVTKPIPKVASV